MPVKPGFRIKDVWVFTVIDGDDEEGIIGAFTPMGWMPFIGGDEVRVKSLRQKAEGIAKKLDKEVRLVRFSNRDEVEVLNKKSR